jgi:hypothetical protein
MVARRRLYFAFAFMLTAQFAIAGQRECQDAIDRYNSTLDDVSSTLRRYANCVSNSRGSDDCSSEFRRLRSAQSDYEDAVGTYQRECR